MSLSRVAALAFTIGLIAGTLEAALMEAMLRTGTSPHGARHVVWMAPLADGILVLAFCLAAHALGRWIPALRRPPVVVAIAWATAAFALLLTLEMIDALAVALLAAGAGGVTYRLILRRADAVRPLRTAGVTLAACGLALALLVRVPGADFGPARDVSPAIASSAGSAPQNVLLIILDTVRARSLGLYGNDRNTSPFLQRWAAGGTTFGRAIAPAPWTLPSHASMFTGQPPSRLSTHFVSRLDHTYPTLAEELSRQGYATAGFVANLLYASRFSGLARGFHTYDDFPISAGQVLLSAAWGKRLAGWDWLRNRLGAHELLNRKSAASIIDRFLAWSEDRGDERRRPFFAFLNLFDAHEPYLPPEPFHRRFAPSGSRGDLLHLVSIRAGNEAIRPRKWAMSEADRELDLALYEGAIAYVDAQLERLFRAMEDRGDLDETLVIITSDHGEQFGEHGLYRHINSLYMPLLHVPLVMRHPATVPAGRRVEIPVSPSQIPATVMDLLDLRPTADFPGPSLARAWSDGFAPPPFSELEPGPVEQDWYPIASGRLRSLVSGPLHYIRDQSGGEELYDLTSDPDETVNLAAHPGHAVELARLRARLDSTVAEAPDRSRAHD